MARLSFVVAVLVFCGFPTIVSGFAQQGLGNPSSLDEQLRERELIRRQATTRRKDQLVPAERHPSSHHVWREIADPYKHLDYMGSWGCGGHQVEASRDNLVPKYMYFCRVDKKVLLAFNGMDQVKTCQRYFQQQTHPSTANSGCELEHYWHPWYCRLPKGITAKPKRTKVLKRLEDIVEHWDATSDCPMG